MTSLKWVWSKTRIYPARRGAVSQLPAPPRFKCGEILAKRTIKYVICSDLHPNAQSEVDVRIILIKLTVARVSARDVASHERWQPAKVRETDSVFALKHLAGAVALVLPGFVRLTQRTAGPNRLALRDPDADCETGASLSPVTAGS